MPQESTLPSTTSIATGSAFFRTVVSGQSSLTPALGIGFARLFVQTSAPTGIRTTGDLWINTTSGNNTYNRWNGSSWDDVTPVVSGGSIADGSVTNAKLADMATLTIKGNDTGLSAAPQDLSVAEVRTMLGLGSSAYLDSGNGDGDVPTGDGTITSANIGELICVSANGKIGTSGIDYGNVLQKDGSGTDLYGVLKIEDNLSDVDSAASSFDNIKQSATDSYQGVGEIATQTEVNAGTDTSRWVTPSTLSNWSGLPTTPAGKVLAVDGTSGNNSTAERGNIGRPYATINGAEADAQSGDTILIWPGSYAETIGNISATEINYVALWTIAPQYQNSKSVSVSSVATSSNNKFRNYSGINFLSPATISGVGGTYRFQNVRFGNTLTFTSAFNCTFTNCQFQSTFAAGTSGLYLELDGCFVSGGITGSVVTLVLGGGTSYGVTGSYTIVGSSSTIYRDFRGVSGSPIFRIDGRHLGNKGSDVASAGTITLGTGNYFVVTGTTNIDYITTTDWTAGSVVYLEFDGILDLNNNTGSVPANTASILTDTGASITTAAGDVVRLIYNGTNWKATSP